MTLQEIEDYEMNNSLLVSLPKLPEFIESWLAKRVIKKAYRKFEHHRQILEIEHIIQNCHEIMDDKT